MNFLFHRLLILFRAATTLPALQVRQASCLGVNISDLLVALRIEGYEFLASRRAQCFLEVRIEASPSRSCLISDTVALIKVLSAISRLVLCVKLREGVGEAVGYAVLVVKGNGTLDRGVANRVAVGEVLGNDARAWLVFLRNVMFVAGGILGVSAG